jgi:hypothetical protein
LISENMRIAYVDDRKSPRSSPGRGKRLVVLKQGDVLNGFVLKNIESDKITMVRGDDVITVNLMDTKAKTRAETGAEPHVFPSAPPPPPIPQNIKR